MKKGEFELISSIKEMFPTPSGVLGIGDDCAVLPQAEGCETLVSTDMLIEGVHFIRERITPFQLGWKSAAVNFSDIAAMGGEPVGSFLALSLPSDLPDGWVEGFMDGYRSISKEYGFPLLGGDTTSSKGPVCICVTVLGRAPKDRSLKRSGARPGDLICVTGTLGDSAAGLLALLGGIDGPLTTKLIEKHLCPHPRIAEGLALASAEGVHAAMDISDGIGSDLRHILDESGVGAEVDTRRVPVSPELELFCGAEGRDLLELALSGGEDYELLFTVDPEEEKSLPVAHTVIGRITAEPGLKWKGSRRNFTGYKHF